MTDSRSAGAVNAVSEVFPKLRRSGPKVRVPTSIEGSPVAQASFLENTLLGALPRRAQALLRPALESVDLSFGDLLHHQGQLIRHVYFPGSALISLLVVAEGHPALEVGLIGREGVVGVAVALGNTEAAFSALVQGSGTATRMTVSRFRQELVINPALQRMLLRFSSVFTMQVSQTAACNRFHRIEQRLARWLLMCSDRLQAPEFRMTHEFLGHMLGVRRVGVTEAAHTLHHQGLIRYHRGVIVITDRAGLEAAACRCYQVVSTAYANAQLLSPAAG